MSDYYKALRPQWTDFATAKTSPTLGEWMPPIEGVLILNARGYHVSDFPCEALRGGWWPCVLLHVEIPEGDWPRAGHTVVVPTYRPIAELPAWRVFGPHGAEVVAFIEAIHDVRHALRVVQERQPPPPPEEHRTWARMLWRLPALDAAIAAARGAVLRKRGPLEIDAVLPAADAARTIVTAIVLRDALPVFYVEEVLAYAGAFLEGD